MDAVEVVGYSQAYERLKAVTYDLGRKATKRAVIAQERMAEYDKMSVEQLRVKMRGLGQRLFIVAESQNANTEDLTYPGSAHQRRILNVDESRMPTDGSRRKLQNYFIIERSQEFIDGGTSTTSRYRLLLPSGYLPEAFYDDTVADLTALADSMYPVGYEGLGEEGREYRNAVAGNCETFATMYDMTGLAEADRQPSKGAGLVGQLTTVNSLG